MIGDAPLLTVRRELPSLDQLIVARFRGVPTSFIVDAMGGRGALDWRIKPFGATVPFVGTALPCHCGPADNLALCAAVAMCRPGDVIVAATDGFTGTSVVGDLLLGIAANRRAAGFVTDGLIRDRHDIELMHFPCWAMGVTPNSPARNGPGEVGLPVTCGGVQVSAGDLIAGDRDGVVVVPHARIAEVTARLADVIAAEDQLLAKVREGLKEVGFVADVLTSQRTRLVDGTGT